MRRFVVVWAMSLVMLGATAAAWSADKPAGGAYLFAYFKEPGSQGIYLALSRDGYKFEPLNDGQPWVKPEKPGEIMRDVFLTRKPGGDGFRMVWTWDWRGSSLGTAESGDLLKWSEQVEVPIMREFATVHNVWAPETYWDEERREWLVIWSSSFTDRPEGNRIWAARTRDFVTFTRPEKFFDPGYVVIDATMFHGMVAGRRQWAMVFKDQQMDPLRYQVRWMTGPTVEGPWSAASGPITESWSEGPSVVHVGDAWVVYYDHYRAPRARYEGVRTRDWVHWESVNDEMQFPEHSKHGSFLRVTEAEAERLLARHDGVQ